MDHPNQEPRYEMPPWLRHRLSIGYLFASSEAIETFGEHYARETDQTVSEYFGLYLQNPQEAISRMPEYFQKLADINNNPAFDTHLLSGIRADQFGLIVNVASLRYEDMQHDNRLELTRHINSFLATKNMASGAGYTAELRNVSLIRDLTAQWSMSWPETKEVEQFLGAADPDEIVPQILNDRDNNPTLFALAVPAITTNPEVRSWFQYTSPDSFEESMSAIATRIFCRGLHEQGLGAAIYGAPTTWERSINEMLKEYSKECRPLIVEKIVNNQAVRDSDMLSDDYLVELVHSVRFGANPDFSVYRMR